MNAKPESPDAKGTIMSNLWSALKDQYLFLIWEDLRLEVKN